MSRTRPTTRELLLEHTAPPEIQQEMEKAFFSRVLLPGGTFKTTYANRLDDVNRALLPHLPRRDGVILQVMDVAASSAVSSHELAEFLHQNDVPCKLLAGDRIFFASLVTICRRLEVLINRDRQIIHIDFLNCGMPPRVPGWREMLTGTLRGVARFAMWLDGHLPPLNGAVNEAARGRLVQCEPVILASRRVIEMPEVRLEEDDLLAPNRLEYLGAFDLIRAANILNLGYFDSRTLASMVTTIQVRLRPAGILVVCRTDAENLNHATIFRKGEDGRFAVVGRIGNGSEIETIVLSLRE